MTLDLASGAFLEGYRLARMDRAGDDPSALARALAGLDPDRAPFAHEGAAMAWRVDEARAPDPGRSARLREAVDRCWHPFLALGVGCALARLGVEPPDDPTVRDGFGFQLGLADRGWRAPGDASWPEAERGRGRALWFVTGGDAEAVARRVGSAPHILERWRGVATACTFAGDPRGHAERLPELAPPARDAMAAGARSALRLWRTLGTPPARVLLAAEALDHTDPGRGPTPP